MFAEYVGGPHATALSSATAGRYLALKLRNGIKAGDEVITTAMTFAATVNGTALVGATLVLVDIDRGTLQMNIDEVAKKLPQENQSGSSGPFRRTAGGFGSVV